MGKMGSKVEVNLVQKFPKSKNTAYNIRLDIGLMVSMSGFHQVGSSLHPTNVQSCSSLKEET